MGGFLDKTGVLVVTNLKNPRGNSRARNAALETMKKRKLEQTVHKQEAPHATKLQDGRQQLLFAAPE